MNWNKRTNAMKSDAIVRYPLKAIQFPLKAIKKNIIIFE